MRAARGSPADRAALDRLIADLRVLDADGIRRLSWAWDRHEREQLSAYREAERGALAAIEKAERGDEWQSLHRELFGLTEARGALSHWRDEHGERAHKAERAAFGAALGVFARELIPHDRFVALVRPMAEVLPWLLPDEPPEPRGR